MKKIKRKYKDKVAAMLALARCKKSGEKGHPTRNEKRIYFDNGNWYLTSKKLHKQKTETEHK